MEASDASNAQGQEPHGHQSADSDGAQTVPLTCPAGHLVGEDATFCPHCGAAVVAAEQRPRPRRRWAPFALPSQAPRLLTRGKTVSPRRAILETAGLFLAYELVIGYLILPSLLELAVASLIFLWGLRRLDRITVPRLAILYLLAGAGEALGVEVIDPTIHRLLGYPQDFIALARGWWAGHRSILSAGVYVLLPVLLLAYFNPGIRAELKSIVRAEGRGLDPLRSLGAAVVAIVFVLSLLSTDLELGSVGYVHRYTPSAADRAAATEPVATTPDPVAACANELQSLMSQAEDAADYDNDGRADTNLVMQELAQLVGAEDPRFRVLVTAYGNFQANRFAKGGAAALQMFRDELEESCRANSSATDPSAVGDQSSDDTDSDSDSSATDSADPSVTDDQDGDGTDGDLGSLPDGLFCRDLKAQGLSYADAVAYYVAQGRPDRMDKDLNAIPCETVYSRTEVQSYIAANGQP